MTTEAPVKAKPATSEPLALNRVASASFIGCSAKTLDRYRKQGLITPIMHGRRPTYVVEDLKALVEALRARTLT